MKIRLVRNGKIYYVPSVVDYEVLKGLGIPLMSVDLNRLPLLKSRCRQNKIKILIKGFEEFEALAHKKIKDRWEHGFYSEGKKTYIEVPRKKSLYQQAQRLVDSLAGFYGRHLFDTNVRVRKFSKKVRFIIERTFNEQKQPEWKEKSPS